MIEKSFFVSLDSIVYNVRAGWREGGDDLLLFLHGLGCSKNTFRDVWSQPGFDSFSILALDLPGFGDSPEAVGFSYSMEDHARVCAGVLSQVDFQRLHLIGHSMGGAIGLVLPEHVLRSVHTFANVEGNLNPEDCVFGSRKASSVSFEEFLSKILPELKHSSDTWRENGLDVTSPVAFYQSARSLVEWSDSGQLLQTFRDLQCRKAYVYGEENAKHPTVGTVDGIQKIEIGGAGHFAMNDNSDVFYSELLNFVRES